MRRFLCVCEGGNCRSVALAQALKDCGQDALSCGWRYNSPETLRALAAWADVVVLMQPLETAGWEMLREQVVTAATAGKLRVLDVGPDRWYVAQHPELVSIIKKTVVDWQRAGFAIV